MIYYDVTTKDTAIHFLLDSLGFKYYGELWMEYFNNCNQDLDEFWVRNHDRIDRIDPIDINDVRFVAFHVTGSLDDCKEIKATGIRNLQYVLSHKTMLADYLKKCGIVFDIQERTMFIDGQKYDIDYGHCYGGRMRSPVEGELESVAHRIYYDFCVDGFMYNDHVEAYGTNIHKRPEFITTLINLSSEAQKLDSFWSAKSKPYKIYFYATADQIHKFTFDLEKNYYPYTLPEQSALKKWMLLTAVDRAFEYCHEKFIYIRDNCYISPEQIIRYEQMFVQ